MELIGEFWPHLLAGFGVVAAVSASAHAILHKRDPRAAALWLGMIWFAPVFGALLYLLIGINRVPRRAARRAEVTHDIEVGAAEIEPAPATRGGGPLVRGNSVTPLRGGDDAYAAMIDAINGASDNIVLTTFIFDNDRAGDLFCAALAAAIDRGVEARVLIDAVGTRYSFPSVVGRLRRSGVKVERFERTLLPWRMRYANLRNHRKILVVDGRVGFTGGMNIREGCMLSLEPDHPTLDLHFRLEGPIVAELQRTLAEDWEFACGECLDGARFFPVLERCGSVLARALPDGPDQPLDPIRWEKLAAIARGRSRVRIATPYFVPDTAILSALSVAAINGAEVQILLPSANNLHLVKWASTALLWQILEHGCRVYLSPAPFDHSKLMLVDDDWAAFGSANWDARSFRLNFEFDVECQDLALATQLHSIFEQRLADATEVTLADVDARSLPVRLRDGGARLLAPYL